MAQGNADADGCAFGGRAAQFEIAAVECGAFAHAEQAQGPGAADGFVGDTAPVIGDFENEMSGFLAQADVDAGCAGVSDHIREGFLENAKEGGVQFRIANVLTDSGSNAAWDAALFLEFAGLPFQCGGQTGAVEETGAQFGGNASDGMDGFVDVAEHGAGLFAQFVAVVGKPGGEPGKPELESCEGLAKLVMHLTSDAGAFLFANVLEMDGEGAELLVGLPEHVFGPAAFAPFTRLTHGPLD